MKPAVLPTDRPAVPTLWAGCCTCQAACGGRLMCRYARLPLPSVYRHYGGGEWCGEWSCRTSFRLKRAVWLMTLPYSQALDGNRQCVPLAQCNHSNGMIMYA